MKTEFMTMWDGFQTNEHARVMVLAATNRPWEVDDAILRRLPRSFEVGLPDYKQRVDILSVILRNEPLSPGFLGPAPDAPVFQIARATDRYSGSDLKELCKQAAYGPIRDLLDAERAAAIARQRARLEKALKKQASKSGGTGTHPGVGSGVDDLDGDLDEFFDAEEERDESGARNDGKPRRKRAMTLADFSAVLSKSGTSADAAAKYRHADNERRFDRDARAAHSAYGGGGVSPSGSFLPGVSPEQMAALESVVTPEMVAQLLGAMAGKPDGAAPAPAPASPAEITPEMLAKMMEQFMLQRSAAVPGGGGASPGN
jgi:SpoVK/Ycf46/Vps4 family AAA+-type ATPase